MKLALTLYITGLDSSGGKIFMIKTKEAKEAKKEPDMSQDKKVSSYPLVY